MARSRSSASVLSIFEYGLPSRKVAVSSPLEQRPGCRARACQLGASGASVDSRATSSHDLEAYLQ
eukprot:scaffold14_cov380-Prasinococcus_capsulatus_cf.AAC.10